VYPPGQVGRQRWGKVGWREREEDEQALQLFQTMEHPAQSALQVREQVAFEVRGSMACTTFGAVHEVQLSAANLHVGQSGEQAERVSLLLNVNVLVTNFPAGTGRHCPPAKYTSLPLLQMKQ